MPHFEEPEAGADLPTVEDLNPYGEDNGIALFFPDQTNLPDNLANDIKNYGGAVKSIGLKAPIVVGGWGYDIDGKPVPADSEDGSVFADGYKKRADLWKVGPLDIRWDDKRKVWSTGGGGVGITNIKPFVLKENLLPGGSALAEEYGVADGNWSSDFFVPNSGAALELIHDWMLSEGRQQFAGDKIVAGEITLSSIPESGNVTSTTTIWILINGQCLC